MHSLKRIVLFAAILAAISLVPSYLFAADFYIAQSASGTADGSSCANASACAWFNNASNWANPKQIGKIGPGDTVHICGTVTNPNDMTDPLLVARGNGWPGAPITILWEAGAKLTQPAGPLFDSADHNYLTLDGGMGGIVENTQNGDQLEYQFPTKAITMSGIGNEVRNLIIQNIYIHVSPNNKPAGWNTSPMGVYAYPMSGGLSIDHCVFSNVAFAIDVAPSPGASGLYIHDNSFTKYDHGVAFGGANPPGFSGIEIYNNIFGSTANWDTAQNNWHHDGIHLFQAPGATISNIRIFNNTFDGNWGANNTSHIYLECNYTHPVPDESCSDIQIYNNVHIQYPGDKLTNGFLQEMNVVGVKAYNNTYLGSGNVVGSTAVFLSSQSPTFVNNYIAGVSTFVAVQPSGTITSGAINDNVYANLVASGNYPFSIAGGPHYTSLSAWQGATGQDANSNSASNCSPSANGFCTNLGLNGDGTLQSNSPGLSIGADLTSLGMTTLDSDRIGNARPPASAWDVGAYEHVDASLPPPTGLCLK
ncbi:MAG: hypothetical protein ACP5SH_21075 [Syntrophobacteraceae bacterium]